MLYKVINTGPNVSRNCKHGSLVDSDGLERGGDGVVTLLGKGNTQGNSTLPVLGILYWTLVVTLNSESFGIFSVVFEDQSLFTDQ